MRRGFALLGALLVVGLSWRALAQTPQPTQKTQIEIYRVVPGQHEAFLRWIATGDETLKAAGLPPRQLFVHQDGADWDFILMQPAGVQTTPQQEAARVAARQKAGLPGGARFFLEFRKLIAEHSDTVAEGPTTAAAWLAKLDEPRKP